MSSNLPVVLGGDPVRAPGSFRTTPEVGARDVDYISAQVLARDWEPDATRGGLPVRDGLPLPTMVATMLGVEQAALAAEFAAVHAPGRSIHVLPCDNGTHVIRLALAALTKVAPELGLRVPEPGDEVIVPALTWQATATACLRRNLVPVLVDVLPGTLCLDPDAAREAITDRTVGMLPVHLYNRMAAIHVLREFTRKYKFAVGEDCAHAHGARFRGRPAGTFGLWGSFSAQGSKSLSSQEGGLLLTWSQAFAEQFASLVTCGRRILSRPELLGDNDRIPGVVAALARAQLERFPEQNGLRVATFGLMDGAARELPGIAPLDVQKGIDIPPTYKWAFRVDLSQWEGMTLDQLGQALSADLSCEVVRIYHPLAGEIDPHRYGNPYEPHSDPALNISSEFWERIDRRRYHAPNAWDAFNSVLVIEHAVGLDQGFPDAFAASVERIHGHAQRIAGELSDG